ncbi:hypothetical protein [Streptomyces enissocaesilis]|uniref:Uncharacterized protein n=1 Tax=Streptomyces enissocaesilis TaxID=332589 RepID=A0ABP6K5S5_9ACTN
MDLSFLTPLYERSGPWASACADTSIADGSTPRRRELSACQEETRAGLLVPTGGERERRAVHGAPPRRLKPLAVETDHGGRSAGQDSRLPDEGVERAGRAHARKRAAAELGRRVAAGGRHDRGRGDPGPAGRRRHAGRGARGRPRRAAAVVAA